MRKLYLLLIIVCITGAAGCGAGVKLSSSYRFAEKGVPKKGDVLRIFIKGDSEFTADLSFAFGDSSWIPIRNKKERAEKFRTSLDQIAYRVKYLLHLPNITSKNLRFKVTAVSKEGRKSEEIITIRETVDSFKPKAKITFNPFTL